MSEENDSLIGFDPLAWMKEEGEETPAETPAQPPAQAPAAAAADPAPAEPVPAPEQVAEEPPVPAAESEPAPEPQPAAAAADDGAVVALGDTLDIAHVSALYERLSGALNQGREPALDGSELERVDAAGLQLLCAYGRELKSHGHAIEWRGEPAEALREAAVLLDLQETLGLAA